MGSNISDPSTGLHQRNLPRICEEVVVFSALPEVGWSSAKNVNKLTQSGSVATCNKGLVRLLNLRSIPSFGSLTGQIFVRALQPGKVSLVKPSTGPD